VVYRLVDAEQYRNQRVLVVGGGDSALEAALAIAAERGAIGQRIFIGGLAAALALIGLILAWLKVYRTLARWSIDMNELLRRRSASEREMARRAEELRERESAAGTASQNLSDAVESLNDGFVLWDKNDKLVICNSRYRSIYPIMADLNVPGADFETHVRTAVARGLIADANGRVDSWVAERIARFRAANSAHLRQLPDGRWFRVSEHRTAAGGVVGLVREVLWGSANDNLVVDGPAGEVLIPFIEDVILAVDLPAGTIIIEPLEGLLDLNEKKK